MVLLKLIAMWLLLLLCLPFLSLSRSNKLIEFSKELSKNEAAMKRLSSHRTTSYNLTYGLGRTSKSMFVSVFQTIPFTLNMDKSISSNVRHVFMILVSYYCDVTNKVLVEHLEYSCTSDNLFFMKALFKKRFLPRKNLLAMLSDSASTIRSTVTSLETKLRGNLAQQVLNRDAESCHHMRNIRYSHYFLIIF